MHWINGIRLWKNQLRKNKHSKNGLYIKSIQNKSECFLFCPGTSIGGGGRVAVIEEDVIQISWSIDDDPFSEMLNGLKDFKKDVGIAVDDANDSINDMRKTALKAVDGLEEISNTSNGAAKDVAKLGKGLINVGKSKLNGITTTLSKGKAYASEFFKEISNGKNDVDSVSNSFDGLKDKIKSALAVAGISSGIGAVVGSINNATRAVNQFQSKTGVSADEMKLYGEDIKYLYSQGMGESINDVAEAMATVKNNTRFDGEEVMGITQNALLLRDTFDYDVGESIRAAQMLMDQFSISGNDAYNLIVQGAQNGLDKNGDLLDTINEYSVHFKSLGMDSEQMFNMLVNGVNNGTFSVDKLGDSIKEFGIRAIDQSETSALGFELLGLDADEMTNKFAAGGDTAKEAFDQVTKALSEMTDPVNQNIAAVNLFGTMAEDLGVDGVLSMKNLEGEISLTSTALEDINNIRYDDAGSALVSLGRTINLSLADAVGGAVNKAKGYINEFTAGLKGNDSGTFFSDLGAKAAEFGQTLMDVAGFVKEHKDIVIALATALLVAKGAIVAWNVATVISKGIAFASVAAQYAYAAATGATVAPQTAATAATWGFNTALLANPITWIVLAIIALIAVIVLLALNWEKVVATVKWAWNDITSTIKDAWNWLCDLFSGIGNWIKTNVIDPIVGFFKGLWDSICGIFSSVVSWININIIQPINKVFLNLIYFMLGLFLTIWDGIKAVFSPVINWFKEYIIQPLINSWNNFKTGMIYIINLIVNTIKSIWGTISDWVIEHIIQPLINSWNNFKTGLSYIITGVVNTIKSIWGTISGWVDTNIIQPVSKFFSGLWDSITNAVSSVKDAIVNAFTGAFNKVKEVWEKITGFFSGIWDGIKGTVDKIINRGKEAIGVADDVKEKDGGTKHALGGLMLGRHVGIVAEAGPEMIIPLSKDKKKRGIDLWQQTGQMLGVDFVSAEAEMSSESADVASYTPENSSYTTSYSNENNTYAPSYNVTINGANMDSKALERQVKDWIREATEDAFKSISRRKPRMTEV